VFVCLASLIAPFLAPVSLIGNWVGQRGTNGGNSDVIPIPDVDREHALRELKSTPEALLRHAVQAQLMQPRRGPQAVTDFAALSNLQFYNWMPFDVAPFAV